MFEYVVIGLVWFSPITDVGTFTHDQLSKLVLIDLVTINIGLLHEFHELLIAFGFLRR